MATPHSILTANSCVPCSGTSLADVLEINILQSILTAQGASMTQAQIMAAVPCYTCLGISLADAIKLVLLNAMAVASGAGGTGTIGIVSPQGVVTAVAGSVYYDSVAQTFWVNLNGGTTWQQLI